MEKKDFTIALFLVAFFLFPTFASAGTYTNQDGLVFANECDAIRYEFGYNDNFDDTRGRILREEIKDKQRRLEKNRYPSNHSFWLSEVAKAEKKLAVALEQQRKGKDAMQEKGCL